MGIPLVFGFSNEDKLGTTQPHDDALVVTLRIGGYDVKRVMINQGSTAEIMYHDLFKGLNLKPENLIAYSSPLVSFEGKMVIPKVRSDYPCKLVQMWLRWTLLWLMLSLHIRPLWANPGFIPWEPLPPLFTRR